MVGSLWFPMEHHLVHWFSSALLALFCSSLAPTEGEPGSLGLDGVEKPQAKHGGPATKSWNLGTLGWLGSFWLLSHRYRIYVPSNAPHHKGPLIPHISGKKKKKQAPSFRARTKTRQLQKFWGDLRGSNKWVPILCSVVYFRGTASPNQKSW